MPPPDPPCGFPTRAKLAATLLFVAGTVLLPREPHPVFLLPAGLLIAVWIWVRMPLGFGLKRLLLAEFFILGLVLLSIFDPVSRPVALSAIIKSNLSVLALVLLAYTTPFQEILLSLRSLGVPAILVTTLTLMWRYLPVLKDETRRMQRARASRSFSRRKWLQWGNLSEIIARLFVRTADRADRIYLAMCSRGWK